MKFEFQPIGTIDTPFKEKFGAPRQALLATEATGVLKLDRKIYFSTVKDLEQFSHIWLIYPFHKNNNLWHPLIDTPRVESKKVGVFATRSPHRPNSIGMSAVKLDRIDYDHLHVILYVSGVDILDGTPIFDIKPYLPYSDSIVEANSGWISGDISRYPVSFSTESEQSIAKATARHPRLQELMTQLLELDPRPTSQRRAAPMNDKKSEGSRFAFRILDLDVHWSVKDGGIFVEKILNQ